MKILIGWTFSNWKKDKILIKATFTKTEIIKNPLWYDTTNFKNKIMEHRPNAVAYHIRNDILTDKY